MSIVYKITNKINGKSYVGYTSRTINQRWRSHLSSARQGSPFRFHSAIRKYGEDAWLKEVLYESEDIEFIKKKEEELILDLNLIAEGYNAKPGGCGGWIVKPENYQNWLNNQRDQSGSENGNSIKIGNDEIVDLAINYYKEFGKIPGHRALVKYGEEFGIKVPKSFTKYRFEGSYKNLVKILEEMLNITYNPYEKTQSHRDKLSTSIKGRYWWSNDELKISKQCYEEDLDKNLVWYRGRKYGN